MKNINVTIKCDVILRKLEQENEREKKGIYFYSSDLKIYKMQGRYTYTSYSDN